MPRIKAIKIRRDTASSWTFVNPVLANGEGGLETDTDKLKYGDGVTPWNSLPYLTQGLKGDKGDKGDKGSQGVSGNDGADGAKGDKGDTGLPGSQGPQGPTGATGPQGPKGDRGDRGLKGDTGSPGPQGIQGEKGDKGLKGDTGLTGAPGAKGDKGDTGATGPQGAQGIQGLKGDKGDTGDTGATGPQGEQGPQGIQGVKGDTGAGVVAGGTANQSLTKIDGTDYNTQWSTIDKTFVGLSDVDNTSDLDKPISAAVQEALDNKMDLEVDMTERFDYDDPIIIYTGKAPIGTLDSGTGWTITKIDLSDPDNSSAKIATDVSWNDRLSGSYN